MVEHEPPHLDRVFHALADPTRRGMLRRLSARSHTVTELAAPVKMSLAAASKHVRVLEDAGLVQRRISGRRHICRLAPERLGEAWEWLRFYRRFWNERLNALEAALNTPDHDAD